MPSGSQTWLPLLVTWGTFSKGYCSSPTPRYSDLIGSRRARALGLLKAPQVNLTHNHSDSLLTGQIWGEVPNLYVQTRPPGDRCSARFVTSGSRCSCCPKQHPLTQPSLHSRKDSSISKGQVQKRKAHFAQEELCFLNEITFGYSWVCGSHSYHPGFLPPSLSSRRTYNPKDLNQKSLDMLAVLASQPQGPPSPPLQ